MPGILAAPGTGYRMDEIPMPLKPAIESPYPSDEEIVRRINEAIKGKGEWAGKRPQMVMQP